MLKSFLCLLLFAALSLCAAPPAAESDAPMKYRRLALRGVDFTIVEKAAKDILSKDGRLYHNPKQDAVIVYDTMRVSDRVRDLIEQLHPPEYNIRVTIDYQTSEPSETASAGTSRRRFVSDSTRFGPRTVHLTRGSGLVQQNDSMSLTVLSGMSASLWKGKMMIDPQWLSMQVFVPEIRVLIPGHGEVVIPGTDLSDVKWSEVGARLMIRPVFNEADDTVTVELYPRLSYLDGKTKREQAVMVKTLSTTVTVKNGERFYLGGVIESKNKAFRNLFGPEFFRAGTKGSLTDIYVTCRVLRPGESDVSRPAVRPRFR